MNILVACEYSGIVSAAFRAKGHYVLSCDLLPSDSPGNHYQGDLFDVLYYNWDMMICFPPCTYLSAAGMSMCNNNPVRQAKQQEAIEFCHRLFCSPIPKIALENPRGALSTLWRKPDQTFQPWHFGDPHRKLTCLWLKNLPPLISTIYNTKRQSVFNHTNGRMNQATKSHIRSKFFPLVAEAMANQWS